MLKIKNTLFIALTTSTIFIHAQNMNEAQQFSNIKKNILQGIEQQANTNKSQQNNKIKTIDSKLNKKSSTGNNSSLSSNSAQTNELNERIELLEQRQKLLEEIDWNTFEANVQTAVINLFAMDKQIKPLQLFDHTRIAFTQIGELSNLMEYPGFKDWYSHFSQYINSNKNKESILSIVQTILNSSGAITGKLSLTGPMVQPVLSAISMFIANLGSGKAELKKKSEEMFLVTTKISQLRYELQNVETEWEKISKELELQKQIFGNTVDYVLTTLKLDKNEYNQKFYKSNDPTRVINYYESVRGAINVHLKKLNDSGNNDWKNDIGFQLEEVKTLKLKFGELLFRVVENLKKYDEILQKYKNDTHLSSRVLKINSSVEDLKNSFDSTFSASEYINEARRMYKIF